jgi:tetratricopeptide (TPR) repeat protein
MRPRILSLLAIGCSLALTPTAHALPSPPGKKVSKKDDAHARRLYKTGDRAYAEGRYEDAVAAFEKAYAMSGRSLLLFNLGNAYERLQRYQDAAEALERYLPDAKPSEQDAIAKRVANLKQRAKQQQEQKEREEREAQKRREKAAKPPPPSPQPPRETGSSPTLGYVLLGTGGAALAVGGVFGALALSARHDENSDCADSTLGRFCTTTANAAISRDRNYSLVADIGFGVGIVAAGVGAYLVLTSNSGKEDKGSRTSTGFTSALGATARPGGGELDLVGRF